MTDKTLYLCGPIMGCPDADCIDWRELVKGAWPWRTLDPMRRDYRDRPMTPALDKELVELDKFDISQSDALIVNYLRPSVGTSMEVLYAWQLGKLVVIVDKSDCGVSPWLRYHSHSVQPSFGAAIRFLLGAFHATP